MSTPTLQEILASGPYQPTWDSLENYRIPTWYEKAKFGIFIHWGAYAVPAFGSEWYPRNMYQRGTPEFEHHVKTYGPHHQFGYKDFIPMFQAEAFDPDEWMRLFKAAGAKYVVPVAEHHDGFQMYKSTLSRWNAVEMGPKRDIIGELAASARRHGLHFGVSSHRAEHWFYFSEGRRFESDVNLEPYTDLYGPAEPTAMYWNDLTTLPPNRWFLEDWLQRTCELVTEYQPDLIWFDWWIQHLAFKPYLKQFMAYYYNLAARWNKGVVMNYKYDACLPGTAVLDVERGLMSEPRGLLWQTDTSVSKNSWGFIHGHDYKPASDIIEDLIDIVSKNGVLLLNVGPKADGTLPEPEKRLLMEIGEWLSVYGEGIYDTKPWTLYGEGPTQVNSGAFGDDKRPQFTSEDIRFTLRKTTLYAFVMKWPNDGVVRIRFRHESTHEPIAPNVVRVESLSPTADVAWTFDDERALVVTTPEGEASHFPKALRLTLADV